MSAPNRAILTDLSPWAASQAEGTAATLWRKGTPAFELPPLLAGSDRLVYAPWGAVPLTVSRRAASMKSPHRRPQAARQDRAERQAAELTRVVREIRAAGVRSYAGIAAALNAHGIRSLADDGGIDEQKSTHLIRLIPQHALSSQRAGLIDLTGTGSC